MIEGKWNPEKRRYDISLSEKQYGTLLFALTVAKYESKDVSISNLQKDFKQIMER